jgi:hypothetical protein
MRRGAGAAISGDGPGAGPPFHPRRIGLQERLVHPRDFTFFQTLILQQSDQAEARLE